MNTRQHLLQVLIASYTLLSGVCFCLTHHSRVTQYHRRKLIRIHRCYFLTKPLDHCGKQIQLVLRSIIDTQLCRLRIKDSLHHRATRHACSFTHFHHGRVTYTSQWVIDYTNKCFIICWVNCQTEICDSIFNLLALVETHTAINTIWNTQMAQFILYHARLCIRTIQYRHLLIIIPLTI